MAKVTDLSDKELDDMITKHEKTLQLLIKEKERRTGKPVAVKVKVQAKVQSESTDSVPYQLVIDDDVIAKQNVAQAAAQAKKQEPDDETANMRLTRVLKLSKEELEQFNKAVENKTKKTK